MNFNRIAPFYSLIETLTTGRRMQRGRIALLPQVTGATHVLIAGEGTGRFLAACASTFFDASFTVIDESPAMLARAEKHWRAAGGNPDRVQFICADLLEWTPDDPSYNLIVTHYFLDCFDMATLPLVLRKLTSLCEPGARWLMADFCEPTRGLARLRARLLLRSAYAIFHWLADVPAKQLTIPDPILIELQWTLEKRLLLNWKMIHSDLWRLTRF